jgi:hypothetical protein
MKETFEKKNCLDEGDKWAEGVLFMLGAKPHKKQAPIEGLFSI